MLGVIKNQTYYKTAKICRMISIIRNTLFRWLKEEIFSDVKHRDLRLFTADQMKTNRTKTSYVTAISREN